MYKLYYAPGLASLAPHFVLNEIGAPYELILVDRKKGEHQSADYLALNPNGRIPTLVDGDLTLFEAAAICLHLADRHPDSGLIAAPGSRERALTYQWLTFLTNTVQVDFWQYYRPEFYVSPEDEPAYRARMEEHLLRHLAVLDTALQGRRALAGEQPSIADFYLLLLGRWCRLLSKPTRSFPDLARHLDSLVERPAVQRSFQAESITAPFF
ncbi:glutathione S-transferase family protein [Rhodobacter sp. 24-YEA-8]|uniref:glutathione S-transferase family protein n=1 Tax=Rhodobacter sp. 24-YEA-8 TaxID=1884310 RepID=UPI0008960931|nr:glutathione S-transferase N-terminal domain-containing protein [Rhodobacter sp. 24-YEA-8]SED75687.1 glutathione S-transferase [Rhodobacter sp. 24-YEA-8]